MKSPLDNLRQYAIDLRTAIGGDSVLTSQRVKWYDEWGYAGYTITDSGCIIQWVRLDSGEIKHCPASCPSVE